MHTPIVYSTEISKTIRDNYAAYTKALHNPKTDQVKKNRLFNAFAVSCEKENKSTLAVADELQKINNG